MKILIVKTSALGDIIQCFPVLDFLHHNFSDIEINWVVEKRFSSLIKAHPYIRQVFEIDTKKWKKRFFLTQSWREAYDTFVHLREDMYDFAIDFQGNIKSGLLICSVKSREKIGFSWKSVPEWPNTFFTSKRFNVNLFQPIIQQYLDLTAATFSKQKAKGSSQIRLKISKEEKNWISRIVKPGCCMMICMGSNWENKKLSWVTWRDFLLRVHVQFSPTFYFVWGNEKEKQEAREMHRIFLGKSILLPQISLPVWQQLMEKMNLIFSVDSSALHLAATTKTSTYSFFGPSSYKIYKPFGDHHAFYQGSCPYKQSFIKRCPKIRTCKSGACLKRMPVDVLFQDFLNWFSNEKCFE